MAHGVRPLEGIFVLALEHVIAAPFCTRQLVDLGARVVKVERPGGGDQARGYDRRARGLSSHFVWTNRGKESITLDLKQPAAMEVLHRLAARADVLVQNLAPGAAARMGMSYEALHPMHPRLIVCDISGYGDDPANPGPMRDKKAYDLLIQSEAGFLSVTGTPDAPVKAGASIADISGYGDDPVNPGPMRDKKAYDLLIQSEAGFLSVTGTPDAPAKAGASIADIAAGMYAYSSILAALLQRGRTGEGCRLDVSMLEAMVEWMSFPLYYALDGAEPPPRAGAAHATIYPYGPFAAGDGKVVMLGLQNEREWVLFCERVLQQPALAADPRFDANPKRTQARDALRAIIDDVFRRLTAAEVIERLESAQIANARLNTMSGVWQHEQLLARGRITQVDSPAGPIPAFRPAALPASFDPPMHPIPGVGEHTDALLAELGYGERAIAALHAAGAA